MLSLLGLCRLCQKSRKTCLLMYRVHRWTGKWEETRVRVRRGDGEACHEGVER